jgi:hypothetical protein
VSCYGPFFAKDERNAALRKTAHRYAPNDNRQSRASITVVSHISRKTSEMWGTRGLWPVQETGH